MADPDPIADDPNELRLIGGVNELVEVLKVLSNRAQDQTQAINAVLRLMRGFESGPRQTTAGTQPSGTPVVTSSDIGGLARELRALASAVNAARAESRRAGSEAGGVVAGVIAGEVISGAAGGGTPVTATERIIKTRRARRTGPEEEERRAMDRNARRRADALAAKEEEWGAMEDQDEANRLRLEYLRNSARSLKGAATKRANAAATAAGAATATATETVLPFDFGVELVPDTTIGAGGKVLSTDPRNVARRRKAAAERGGAGLAAGAAKILDLIGPGISGQIGPGMMGPLGTQMANWQTGGGGGGGGPFGTSGPFGGQGGPFGGGPGGGGGGGGGGDLWSLESTQLQVLAAINALQTTQSSTLNILQQQVNIAQTMLANLTQLNVLQQHQINNQNTMINIWNNPKPPPPPNPSRRPDYSTSNMLGGMALGGIGAMLGLGGLVDPNALTTFTGSLKLLGAELGKSFTPYIYAAATGIQWLTGLMEGASDATRGWIGFIGVGTVSLLALGSIVTRVYPLIQTLTKVFWELSGTIMKVGQAIIGFAFAHPVLAAIIGITAAVGTLAGAWYIMGGKAKDAADQIKDQLVPLQGQVTAEAIRTAVSPELTQKILRTKDNEERIRLLKEEQEALEARNKADQPRVGTEVLERKTEAERLEQTRLAATLAMLQAVQAGGSPGAVAREIDRRLAGQGFGGMAELSKRIEELSGMGPVGKGIQMRQQQIGLIGKLIESMGGDPNKPGWRDLKPPIAARYTDALAYREAVQLAALNVPQSETELLIKQMEQFNKNLGQEGPVVNAIKDQTEALSGILQQLGFLTGN